MNVDCVYECAYFGLLNCNQSDANIIVSDYKLKENRKNRDLNRSGNKALFNAVSGDILIFFNFHGRCFFEGHRLFNNHRDMGVDIQLHIDEMLNFR